MEKIDCPTKVLHYLLGEEPDGNGVTQFIGHCLDFDLVSQSDDKATVVAKLDRHVKAQLLITRELDNFFNLCTQAPAEYWEKFHDGWLRGEGRAESRQIFSAPDPGYNQATVKIFTV